MIGKKIKRQGTVLLGLLLLPRAGKRAVMVGADLVMMPVALWSALALNQEKWSPSIGVPLIWVLACLVLSIAVFGVLGLYRAVVRFIAPRAISAVAMGVSCSVVALAVTDRLFGDTHLPLSALVTFFNLALLYVGGTRFIVRLLFLNGVGRRRVSRVMIYGAGSAGAQLASSLIASSECLPLCFIDDNKSLWGSFVNGIEVFGPDNIRSLIDSYGIERILLALPTATRRRRAEILREIESLGVHVQSVPDIAAILAGSAQIVQIRDIDPADLLGRDPVPPHKALMGACILNKTVLVTGAGGSIGSELCRQIIRLQPRRLLLLEMSELALYEIERELREQVKKEGLLPEIVALLGNTHHKYRVREILQSFEVNTIYHAAAYKHVPIVEQNLVEGIHNNVFSTWHAAEAAVECGVEVFVLVSTDKAVNPTNVMGATKRFSEIVLQGLQQRGGRTRFCMVRFGNVLESSGSVVPLFRKQIQRGGPVTVTHPDVIRYFMTIPEASQLVVQASSMAKGGDVFVLDMGKPIRIADLARRMIQLSGYTVRDESDPDGDIEIEFTGLRPAEKLYEELLIGSNVTGTEHPMILRAVEHALPWSDVSALLDRLALALRRFDCHAAIEILREAVHEYRADAGIQDLVWMKRPDRQPVPASDGKVADIKAHRARIPSNVTPL